MKAIIYLNSIEELECGVCGCPVWYMDDDCFQCLNKDCKEFEVSYKAPDEIEIELEKV